ncbi:serine hydrolase domain-containing protein [Rhodohalobacter sp. 614A]|uniref:serine hydrolase domain-containing protein n=1 Tax=Rhodohalobacter sp. 614A TaxID=2908649 RepID=UPI001F2E3D03|nr:serine hydrolase domain-containing protein [Rhodohalobacter sp. 614A]
MEKKKLIVRLLRIIMPILAIISIVIFPPWDGIWAWLPPLPDTVQEQVDDAIDHGLDGIIVYVDQSGKKPAFYSAGWKNKGTRTLADPHALFKIASISKLYIAAAATKLAHNQSLALDDTLADHLPELVGRIEYADQITLRMLLQHRSGIPNFTDQEEFDWFIPQTDLNKNLEIILDKPADFTPDSRHSYSNTNYLLIGRILDNILGYSHHQYIETEILAPLGLTNTYSLPEDVENENIVSGYWYQYEDDLWSLDYLIPGGSMIATAQDVGIFLRALNNGSLLNDDEQAIYSSIYEYEHTGWLPGYQSIARYHKDMDTVVVQFVNTTGGESIMMSNIVYNRIVRILSEQ